MRSIFYLGFLFLSHHALATVQKNFDDYASISTYCENGNFFLDVHWKGLAPVEEVLFNVSAFFYETTSNSPVGGYNFLSDEIANGLKDQGFVSIEINNLLPATYYFDLTLQMFYHHYSEVNNDWSVGGALWNAKTRTENVKCGRDSSNSTQGGAGAGSCSDCSTNVQVNVGSQVQPSPPDFSDRFLVTHVCEPGGTVKITARNKGIALETDSQMAGIKMHFLVSDSTIGTESPPIEAAKNGNDYIGSHKVLFAAKYRSKLVFEVDNYNKVYEEEAQNPVELQCGSEDAGNTGAPTQQQTPSGERRVVYTGLGECVSGNNGLSGTAYFKAENVTAQQFQYARDTTGTVRYSNGEIHWSCRPEQASREFVCRFSHSIPNVRELYMTQFIFRPRFEPNVQITEYDGPLTIVCLNPGSEAMKTKVTVKNECTTGEIHSVWLNIRIGETGHAVEINEIAANSQKSSQEYDGAGTPYHSRPGYSLYGDHPHKSSCQFDGMAIDPNISGGLREIQITFKNK